MMQQESRQWIPIGLNLIAAILGAVGQYLYKLGGTNIGKVSFLRNWPLYGGMALFCAVMVLFVISFKLGGRLSVVYPVYATTFLWATLIAVWVDHEPVSILQIAGIGIVVAGVSLVAVGGHH